jgi:hypothetical protein
LKNRTTGRPAVSLAKIVPFFQPERTQIESAKISVAPYSLLDVDAGGVWGNFSESASSSES